MISKFTAIIMTIISMVSSISTQLPGKSAVYYDVSYGTHNRQIMDVYFPEETPKKIGAVLYIHGGGWVSGDKSAFTGDAKKTGKKIGCISASMNYRYTSKKIDCDDMLDDIDSALEKIKSMAETRGMVCDRVMLVGNSAGAQLSMMYAYTRKNFAPIKPVAVVSLSGPTDLSDENFVKNNTIGTPDSIRHLLSNLVGETITASNYKSKKSLLLEYSPITYISASSVPTLVVHGVKDDIVDVATTRKFVKKLKSNGVKYNYYELPNSGHSLNNDKSIYNESQKMLLKYAQKYVG